MKLQIFEFECLDGTKFIHHTRGIDPLVLTDSYLLVARFLEHAEIANHQRENPLIALRVIECDVTNPVVVTESEVPRG